MIANVTIHHRAASILLDVGPTFGALVEVVALQGSLELFVHLLSAVL